MSLYRRKPSKIWWVKIPDPRGGTPIRRSSQTENKQLAQAFHDKLKRELWNDAQLGIKADKTLREAAEKFLYEKRDRATVDDYQMQLDWWVAQFGEDALIKDVTQERIIGFIERRMDAGSSPATCNRYLAALKACLRCVAIKHKWIDVNRLPVFFMYKEPKGRVRWLTVADMTRFIEACPDYLQPIVVFSLATGLRRSNVMSLRWSQVDMENQCVHIDGDEMKAGENLSIPLPEQAMVAVARQVGKHPEYVFTYQGRPVQRVGSDTWKKILAKAGIENFRWHDLRHCWATMMVRGGAPLHVIQALGAWKSEKMVRRYGHLNTESLKPYTGVVDTVLEQTGARFGTHPNLEDERPRLRAVVSR